MRNVRRALLLGLVATSPACVDFKVDEHLYLCQTTSDCGKGYDCVKGPSASGSTYCVCQPFGAQGKELCSVPGAPAATGADATAAEQ